MIIFDGKTLAAQREEVVRQQVAQLRAAGHQLQIGAILFAEDTGSQLYTQLKREAAERVGIGYQVATFNMTDPLSVVQAQLQQWSVDSAITGIIIQKPWRARWQEVTGRPAPEFAEWWRSLITQIHPDKDVDGLHPQTLEAIAAGTWHEEHKVLPATARAVLTITEVAEAQLQRPLRTPTTNWAILGKSDLLGRPLFYELQHQGVPAQLLGTAELQAAIEQGDALRTAQVVVSATGRHHLVTGELLSPDVVIIDVGEPRPDVDQASVSDKAALLTPVPGGVGPLTVVSLLENAVALVFQV